MKNLILAALVAVLLSACSSTEDDQIKQIQANYSTCQDKYYAASEIVRVDLTDDGKVKSFAVGNQNLQPCQMAKAPKSAMVAVVEVVGSVANTALGVAASSIPYVAMSKIAVDGIKNAGGNTENNGSYNSEANQANQSSIETVSGIKAGGNVDQSQQNQNNPITTNTETNTSTNTDDNSTVTNTDDNSDNSQVTTVQEPVVTEAIVD